MEFAYNRVEVLNRFLWREDQLQRHVSRRLVTTLLEICPRVPALLLCRADEAAPELFAEEVHLTIPVCRVADESAVVGQTAVEELEQIPGAGLQVFWVGTPPASDSAERGLMDELVRRGLLVEPFERATAGLTEVYDDAAVVD